MFNTDRSQPEKWNLEGKPLQSATLAKGETLGMVLYFKVEGPKGAAHSIFAVVRKNNKAVGRIIVAHEDEQGPCDGHAQDVAEYNISDEKQLSDEIMAHAVMMALQLTVEPQAGMSIDIERPLFVMRAPTTATNKQTLMHLERQVNENDREGVNVIKQVLGLGQESDEEEMQEDEQNQDEELENLDQPESKFPGVMKEPVKIITSKAKEKALIKKFGKKPMEKLAKQMKFKGQILNKIKEKQHAN